MRDSMVRTGVIREDGITKESVVHLFQNLVAPYGQERVYSCIPDDFLYLFGRLMRPKNPWSFLPSAVSLLFEKYHTTRS